MRLSADRVKEGILHADQDVREASVYYFAKSFSSDPAVMPLVIQAIEKYGFGDAFQTYTFVQDLVQTDETVRWLIGNMKKTGQPTSMKEAEPILTYISALIHADPSVLKQHEAEIMALNALDPDSKEAITERIWFPSRPAEELWQDFEEFCENQEVEESFTYEDFAFGCRVVDALARHRDQYAKQILEIIGGESNEIGTCKELFAIRLAGEMKLEAAIPMMMAILQESPDEWVAEDIQRAFAKIGDEDGYHEFDTVEDVAQYLSEFYQLAWIERHCKFGVSAPGSEYEGMNYISLYWGTQENQADCSHEALRDLTDDEIEEINLSLEACLKTPMS